MKYTLYYGNLHFTSINIIDGLYKFWTSKIIDYKNKKIWLTIDINLTNNSTFQLINLLPFNSSDYRDVMIVAENKLKSNLLHSKADLIESITFTYYVKDRQLDTRINIYKYIYMIILFTFMLLSIFFLTMYYMAMSSEVTSIAEVSKEVIVNNKISRNQFTVIIDLFKLDSSHCYFPSYFLPSNLVINITDCDTSKEPAGSFIVECVRNKQYETLNYITQITIEHINTMQALSKEYSDIIASTIK